MAIKWFARAQRLDQQMLSAQIAMTGRGANVPASMLETGWKIAGHGRLTRPYAVTKLGWQNVTLPEKLATTAISDDEEETSDRRMRLEAVLLLAKTPLSTRKLAQLAHLADGTEARTLVRHLNRCYDEQGRALRVEQVAGGYRLLTRPAFSTWLARLGYLPPAVRLSSPMMETLAVIAYRQPVSRADIESVRGVACGELLRQLMEKDLARIAGRSEELGRPYLYGTTKRFLQLFGLANLETLPPMRWQSFQNLDPDTPLNPARDTNEPADSTPNDLTTSMKESVVSTSLASVLCETEPLFANHFDPSAVGIAEPLHASPRAIDDDDDDFDDDDDDDDDDDEEEDDLEEEDFDDDWDDEDDVEEDDDVEDADEADDDWEEVDDADVDEEEDEDEDDEEEPDDEEDEDDDWEDDDDEDEDEDEDEWD